MSGHGAEDASAAAAATLDDWSVSSISAMSGNTERHFQPTELSSSEVSSGLNSPRRESVPNRDDTKGMDEIVRSLQTLIDNSPVDATQRLSFQKLECDETCVDDESKQAAEAAEASTGSALHSTPPCKDPGLSGVGPKAAAPSPSSASVRNTPESSNSSRSGKLERIRSTLRDLEKASSRPMIGASRIPRRTLDFSASSSQSRPASAQSASNGTTSSAQSTVVEGKGLDEALKEVEELRAMLSHEQEMRKQLQLKVQELQSRGVALEENMAAQATVVAQKDHALHQMRSQWAQLVQNWKAQHDTLVEQLSEKERQEEELTSEIEKAVKLAADYKGRFELEEVARHKVEAEAEKGLHFLKAKLDNALKGNEQLKASQNELNQSLLETRTDLDKSVREKQDLERQLRQERAASHDKEKEMGEKLSLAESKLSNSHDYYQAQMESILKAKIAGLQQHIEQMERGFLAEKRQLESSKHEQDKQVEILKANFKAEVQSLLVKFEKQRGTLESSLTAARKEADCLRTQLKNAETQRSLTLSSWKPEGDSSPSFQSLPINIQSSGSMHGLISPNYIPLVTPPPTQDVTTTTCNGSPLVPNNKREITARRPSSAVLIPSSTSPHNSTDAQLTQEEKKSIANNYLQEFIKTNPGMAKNQSFLDSLNTMANAMIEQQCFNTSVASSSGAAVLQQKQQALFASQMSTAAQGTSQRSYFSLENDLHMTNTAPKHPSRKKKNK